MVDLAIVFVSDLFKSLKLIQVCHAIVTAQKEESGNLGFVLTFDTALPSGPLSFPFYRTGECLQDFRNKSCFHYCIK